MPAQILRPSQKGIGSRLGSAVPRSVRGRHRHHAKVDTVRRHAGES